MKKIYKLGERAAEVQRLNMLEGCWPEEIKKGQPSDKFIKNRLQKLRIKHVTSR